MTSLHVRIFVIWQSSHMLFSQLCACVVTSYGIRRRLRAGCSNCLLCPCTNDTLTIRQYMFDTLTIRQYMFDTLNIRQYMFDTLTINLWYVNTRGDSKVIRGTRLAHATFCLTSPATRAYNRRPRTCNLHACITAVIAGDVCCMQFLAGEVLHEPTLSL